MWNVIKQISVLWVFLASSLQCVDICKELQSIPKEDVKQLDFFFRELIRVYGFGYTLFGKKPVALLCWQTEPDLESERPYFSVKSEFVDAYLIWKKHQYKFPSNKFVFGERFLNVDRSYTDIFMINKRKFDSALSTHQVFFEKSYDIQTFIEQEKREKYSDELHFACESYHIKMGILLGYGLGNALEFCRRLKAPEKKGFRWILFKELDETPRKRNDAHFPVFFANPDSKETKELFHEYKATQKKLNEILSHEQFLRLVLEVYCGEE